MSLAVGRFRRLFLGISPTETTFAKRGFHTGKSDAWQRLERSASTFVRGYHAALESDNFAALVPRLEQVEEDVRGFAYEGAAMGLAMLDFFLPWKQRLPAFMSEGGAPHIYMLHVGLGWTFARLPRKRASVLSHYDPLLKWLALDGYGFHEGFFSWQRALHLHKRPPHLLGYELRAFDQGLGRSLWFVEGADVRRIANAVSTFPPSRQPDLWSGVGLACAYAGGAQSEEIRELCSAAGPHYPHLAQGVAFAVKARQQAHNFTEHTRLACELVCHLPPDGAVQVVETALQDLPFDHGEPAFEIWRQRIQFSFKPSAVDA